MKNKDKKFCNYCKEPMNDGAVVCKTCGGHKWRFVWFIERFNLLATIISLLVLIFSMFQFQKAQQEYIKAKEAVLRAEKVEKEVRLTGKALGNVLLVLSTMDDRIFTFDVLKFFPALMTSSANALFDAIELQNSELQDAYKIKGLIHQWLDLSLKQDTTDNSKPRDTDIEKLEKEIQSLIIKH